MTSEKLARIPEEILYSPGFPAISRHEKQELKAYGLTTNQYKDQFFSILRDNGNPSDWIPILNGHIDHIDSLLKQHGIEKRASGDPTISHGLYICACIAGLNLEDRHCLNLYLAGLYHDISEDLGIPIKQIYEWTNYETAFYVAGMTKVPVTLDSDGKIAPGEGAKAQELTQQKILRMIIKDPPLGPILKVPDAAHNGLTGHFKPQTEKRILKAHRALDIYAPLARSMGWDEMAEIIEECYFPVVNNEDAKKFQRQLNQHHDPQLFYQLMKEVGFWSNSATNHGNNLELIYAKVRQQTPYSIFQSISKGQIFNDSLLNPNIRLYVPERQTLEWYRFLALTYGNRGSLKNINPVTEDIRGNTLWLEIPLTTNNHNETRMIRVGIDPDTKLVKPLDLYRKHTLLSPEQQKNAQLQIKDIRKYFIQLTRKHGNQQTEDQYSEASIDTAEALQVGSLNQVVTPNGDIIKIPQGHGTFGDALYAISSELGNLCDQAQVTLPNGSTLTVTDFGEIPETDSVVYFLTRDNRQKIIETSRFDVLTTRQALRGARNGVAQTLGKATGNSEIPERVAKNKIVHDLDNILLSVLAKDNELRPDINLFRDNNRQRAIQIINRLIKWQRPDIELNFNLSYGFNDYLREKFQDNLENLLQCIGLTPIPLQERIKERWLTEKADDDSPLYTARGFVNDLIRFYDTRPVIQFKIENKAGIIGTVGTIAERLGINLAIKHYADNSSRKPDVQVIEITIWQGSKENILLLSDTLKHTFILNDNEPDIIFPKDKKTR